MINLYHIFGLNITSAIPLPAIQEVHPPPDISPDVTIVYGDTPDTLANPLFKGVRFQAAPGEFLLRVDDIARYYVHNGDHVTITPEKGARRSIPSSTTPIAYVFCKGLAEKKIISNNAPRWRPEPMSVE